MDTPEGEPAPEASDFTRRWLKVADEVCEYDEEGQITCVRLIQVAECMGTELANRNGRPQPDDFVGAALLWFMFLYCDPSDKTKLERARVLITNFYGRLGISDRKIIDLSADYEKAQSTFEFEYTNHPSEIEEAERFRLRLYETLRVRHLPELAPRDQNVASQTEVLSETTEDATQDFLSVNQDGVVPGVTMRPTPASFKVREQMLSWGCPHKECVSATYNAGFASSSSLALHVKKYHTLPDGNFAITCANIEAKQYGYIVRQGETVRNGVWNLISTVI